MTDTIIVRRRCNTCPATEDSATSEFGAIQEATLALATGAPVKLHFCDDCRSKFIIPLLELGEPITVKSKKVKEPKKARNIAPPGNFPCPGCGKEFSRSQGLGRHRTSGACKEIHLKLTPGTRRKKVSA